MVTAALWSDTALSGWAIVLLTSSEHDSNLHSSGLTQKQSLNPK